MSEKSLRNINNRNHTLSLHRTQKLLESILVYVLRQERCVDAASRDIIRYKHRRLLPWWYRPHFAFVFLITNLILTFKKKFHSHQFAQNNFINFIATGENENYFWKLISKFVFWQKLKNSARVCYLDVSMCSSVQGGWSKTAKIFEICWHISDLIIWT